jgi:isoquinoline 1-oxidoreductase beta subunit
MNEIVNISRRDFFKFGAVLGGGLVLGLYFPTREGLAEEGTKPSGTFAPNAWLRIGTDGMITIMLHKSEMGQGTMTALSMIIADELEADWTKIRPEFAPADKAYYTWRSPTAGEQSTGGSRGIRGSWDIFRKAGATAREMLIAAAAETWGVDVKTCRAEKGEVFHSSGNRRLPYGALAEKAATLPVPKDVPLKDPKDFRFIGTKMARLDTPSKVNGSAVFGIDVKIPGMLIAAIAHCPVFGGKVASCDATRAKAIPGVKHVVEISTGLAVVAGDYWTARQGLEALEIKWDEGSNANLSSAGITEMYKISIEQQGAVARHEGDIEEALANAAKTVEADYEVPFLDHAPMEPMNCTAHVRPDGCDVWVPTQVQTRTQRAAMKITGLPEEAVKVHTTLLGGGFGRRLEVDFVEDAVEVSKAIGAPVKVIWSREESIQHGFYRPATFNRLRAGLDGQGTPVAWAHRIVGPSIASRRFPDSIKKGIDPSSVEGAANIPYAISNLHADYLMKETGIPVGAWRSVGSSQNAFITECFIDEVAIAAGKDPYEFRRQLLSRAPRHKAVLELAATKAGWGQPLPGGRYRGLAVAESFGSFVAQVAEISIRKDGKVQVHRVVCAVDCGQYVNPDTIEAQMQGGIVYGLTATLYGEITIEKGRVKQSNFHDYPLLRIDEMPAVEVYIVPSTEAPGGIGEPGVPPIAPAVVNAIFAATGKRIRKLPIPIDELKRA